MAKIAISGPGRSGTSLLVRLFAEWGFSVPPNDANWHERARAGLELRIDADSNYEVHKHPWAHEYWAQIPASVILQIDALFVPIRELENAAISRSVQERAARVNNLETDSWRWNSWGFVPGGAVARTDVESIAGTLAYGLWELLEKSTAVGLTPILLNFPRFVFNFEYLWDHVSPIVSERQSKKSAFSVWERVSDPAKIRFPNKSQQSESARIRELQGLIEIMRTENLKSIVAMEEEVARLDADSD